MSEIVKYFENPLTAVDINNYSRYKKLKRILEDNDEQYIESYEDVNVGKNSDDAYHIISLADVNRLDLVSQQYYNTPFLWWVIAEASGISDPFQVPLGTVLRVPQLRRLFNLIQTGQMEGA